MKTFFFCFVSWLKNLLRSVFGLSKFNNPFVISSKLFKTTTMNGRMVHIGMLVFVCISFLQVAGRVQRPIQFSSTCEGRGTPRMYSDAPCNLRKRSYCTEPGDMYPKHAVRRFVSDNQGLMRRMYGDMRHLSVLRSEMDWNDAKEQSATVQRSPDATDRMNSNDINNNASSAEKSVNNSTTTTTAPTTQAPTSPATTTEKPEVDKGIYACPTRQEVVAPYWAVNTRGRTLAIVNDPPYEQHIHWEKCLHENQQMLCRDGCRCEQQYRLQRLLTFDPSCDCKGVFMDWFLLPSCCVCKCYGISYNVTQNITSGRRRGRQEEEEDNDTAIDYDEEEEWQENSNLTDHPLDSDSDE